MLNLDLLRTTYRNGKFFCRFADVSKEENLGLAAALAAVFREGVNKCRCDLASLTKNITAAAPDPKLAAGLEKLLFDSAQFDAPDPDVDYAAMRRELFERSGAAMASEGDFSEEHYRSLYPHPARDIYGDLPDFEVLRSFRELTPEALLHRYNIALVQTMLLYTSKLTLRLSDPEHSELRKLVRFMKFFRLLAQITSCGNNTLELELSGPGALLENARKYGLLLGSFFPAVPLLKKYKLHAQVEIRARQGVLELDEKAGLVSHYRNISAYVPEEIRLFHRLFREKGAPWSVVGETPFINMGKKGICFPDLSFRNETGALCHLELFHRWHKGEFPRRLEFMEQNPEIPLIAGIDRGAISGESFKLLASEFPHAAERCFMFRDFPGVETVVKKLNNFVEEIKKQEKERKKHEHRKRKTPRVGS